MSTAFVLVNCHFPFDPTVMDKISKMPAVTSVDRTEGRYELFVKIRGETEGDIRSIVAQEFDSISGVDATLVMMIAQP